MGRWDTLDILLLGFERNSPPLSRMVYRAVISILTWIRHLNRLDLPPITRRPRHGPLSNTIDDVFNIPEPFSPHTQYHDKIVEVPDMKGFENPIDTVNLNIIGRSTPQPGYAPREEPPVKRVLREVHRIWIAPALARVPAFMVENVPGEAPGG